MGTIWVREFTGGLNTVKLPETSTGGILIRANNGHITRGGEFEKRAKIEKLSGELTGTIGLAHDADSLVVFGIEDVAPTLPAGVTYQQLVNPTDDTSELINIHSWDLYAGKLYVAAEFDDDQVYHFYDGVYVELWFDGRARATFTVTDGATTDSDAVAARGSVNVTLILAAVTVTVDHVWIGTTDLLNGTPVVYTRAGGFIPEIVDRGLLATALAAAIASHSGSTGYTATAAQSRVDIVATAAGTAPNRFDIVVDYDPLEVTFTNGVMGGGQGSSSISSDVSSIMIGGIEGLSAPVAWTGSPTTMAAALAAALDANAASTHFNASSTGPNVYLTADDDSEALNGLSVEITSTNAFAFTPATIVTGGGSSIGPTPGKYVKTISKKVYASSNATLFFTGVDAPTQWTTDAVGAGFIDMSTEASGSEQLTAFARYQQLAAIFSENVIQLWYFDPDPDLNRIAQVLENTGTQAGGSVTQFGDTDLFYLDSSGLRSLKARDSSNAAATTDIGIPIDSLIREQLLTMTAGEVQKIKGLIEPIDSRFWLIMKNKAFVFSFFPGTKVSAWSVYDLAFFNGDTLVPMNVNYATVFDRKIYMRSANALTVYGGDGDDWEYDATVAEAWLPYLDANEPMKVKTFQSIDGVARGQWLVEAGLNPNDTDAEEEIARITNTTYDATSIPMNLPGNYVSLRFTSEGDGYAKIAAACIRYDGAAGEDAQ